MKKIKILAIITFALILYTACSDDFLDLQPLQEYGQVEVLSTFEGCENALIGAYSPFQYSSYYGRDAVCYPDVLANNAKKSEDKGSGRYITEYAFSFSQDNTIGLWSAAYRIIARVNNVLEALPGIKDADDYTDADVQRIEAEGRFLRALAHFDLVKFYAQSYVYISDASHPGVPIIVKTEVGEPFRNTVKEVFDFIIEEMTFAAAHLTNDSRPFFANRAAANALLSRMYLYKGDWANAESAANAALADVPDVYTATEWVNSWNILGDNEALFEINNNPFDTDVPGSGENFPALYSFDSYGDLVVTEDAYDIYDATDIRRNVLYTDINGEYRCTKFSGRNNVVDIDNFIVIRVSEVYLNRAEARYEQNNSAGALADLNIIRTNRGLSPLSAASVDDILLERRRELLLEGHMLFDFTRRGLDVDRGIDCYAEVKYIVFENNVKLALPIPDEETNANPNIKN